MSEAAPEIAHIRGKEVLLREVDLGHDHGVGFNDFDQKFSI
jgi:hypothetical protein